MLRNADAPFRGRLAEPEFRTERAQRAAAQSNGGKGVITRFLKALEAGQFTDEQLDIVRRALPPIAPDGAK